MSTPNQEDCQHDIQPIRGDEDWGACVKCGADGYPLTVKAAYGEVDCTTCNDTGMVPVLFEEPRAVFADKQCPTCGGRP